MPEHELKHRSDLSPGSDPMTNLNPVSSVPADVRKEMETTFGFVPSFALTLQPTELRLWWSAVRDFQLSDKTALSPKVKELIGLGVSAQIPCHYCIIFHTEAARLNGATEQELQEAIYMASLTRQGSTILNGSLLPQETFDKDMKEIVAYLKKQAAKAESLPSGVRR
jgi:AhpD family alkylhydroperoxidase